MTKEAGKWTQDMRQSTGSLVLTSKLEIDHPTQHQLRVQIIVHATSGVDGHQVGLEVLLCTRGYRLAAHGLDHTRFDIDNKLKWKYTRFSPNTAILTLQILQVASQD